MKRIFAVFAVMLLLATTVLAAKSTSIEFYDLNGDGVADEPVWVTIAQKTTRHQTVVEKNYFTENYVQYLGQEVTVNGVTMVDTFTYN